MIELRHRIDLAVMAKHIDREYCSSITGNIYPGSLLNRYMEWDPCLSYLFSGNICLADSFILSEGMGNRVLVLVFWVKLGRVAVKIKLFDDFGASMEYFRVRTGTDLAIRKKYWCVYNGDVDIKRGRKMACGDIGYKMLLWVDSTWMCK